MITTQIDRLSQTVTDMVQNFENRHHQAKNFNLNQNLDQKCSSLIRVKTPRSGAPAI